MRPATARSDGIVFGFEGLLVDGTTSELNLHCATIVDGAVVPMVANAHDEGGCPGPDDLGGFGSDALLQLRPRLEAVLRSIPLPAFP